jgi:hypothetical protein
MRVAQNRKSRLEKPTNISAAISTRLRCWPEDRGDVVNCVKLPSGDTDHQVVSGVVGERQAAAVEAVESEGPCSSLVASLAAFCHYGRMINGKAVAAALIW